MSNELEINWDSIDDRTFDTNDEEATVNDKDDIDTDKVSAQDIEEEAIDGSDKDKVIQKDSSSKGKGKAHNEDTKTNRVADDSSMDSDGGGDDDDDDEEEEEVAYDGDNFYNDLYNDMRDGGLFRHTNLEEGQHLDAQGFVDMQQQEYEREVQHRLDRFADGLDEDAKAFLAFKQQGGSTAEFFNILQSVDLSLDGDINDDGYQEMVIRKYLGDRSFDSDDIDITIDALNANGKKGATAEKYLLAMRKDAEVARQQAVEEAKQYREQQQKAAYEFREGLQRELSERSDIAGFRFKKGEKAQIVDFLTNANIPLEDGSYVTPFQLRLHQAMQDKDRMILLAKILNSDFDFKDFERTLETRQTKKIKSRLEQWRKSPRISDSDGFDIDWSKADK